MALLMWIPTCWSLFMMSRPVCPLFPCIHLSSSVSPSRLRALLEEEEQQLLQEMEEKKETSMERQAKMRERAKTLRDRRERDREQLVSDKLEQLFR